MAQEISSEDYALVGLSLIRGLGPHKIRLLLKAFGSADATLGRPASDLLRIPGIGAKLAKAITRFSSLEPCRRQFEAASSVGAYFVRSESRTYPGLLREIFDPPPFLWMIQSDSFVWQTPVAIVGTRKPSSYGRHVTSKVAGALSERGITVVSGLAHGIDAAAHKTVVLQGGRTVAFLGSGLDKIYPRNHRRLAKEIVEQGCLISSFPFGTEPDATNFPQRNRLISGSSHATIVTEAYVRGGALITARFALDQNREVLAIPGPVTSPASEGANKLIQDGTARLMLTAEDILGELIPAARPGHIDSGLFRTLNPTISQADKNVLEALDYTPRHLDEICEDARCNVSQALDSLLNLEFAGCIQNCGGNLYARL
ncbi:MAG: DNA-protecting protein DprA [Rhodothermales bacterium]|nr:DNA-protecting protein DprA [Rhodothermales bacterium]